MKLRHIHFLKDKYIHSNITKDQINTEIQNLYKQYGNYERVFKEFHCIGTAYLHEKYVNSSAFYYSTFAGAIEKTDKTYLKFKVLSNNGKEVVCLFYDSHHSDLGLHTFAADQYLIINLTLIPVRYLHQIYFCKNLHMDKLYFSDHFSYYNKQSDDIKLKLLSIFYYLDTTKVLFKSKFLEDSITIKIYLNSSSVVISFKDNTFHIDKDNYTFKDLMLDLCKVNLFNTGGLNNVKKIRFRIKS